MRFSRPGLVVFCVALLASICVHLPVYQVLGVLADALASDPEPPKAPTQVEFELAELKDEEGADEEAEQDSPLDQPEEPAAVEQPKADTPKEQVAEVQPQLMPTPTPPAPTPPPPEDPAEKLAVTQKSDDPTVQAPDNARFLAEENRVVQEETVSNLRNQHTDEAQPDPGAPRNAESEDLGNADESESADLADVDGSDQRSPTEQEIQEKPDDTPEHSRGTPDAIAAAQAPAPGAAPASQEVQPTTSAGERHTGGAEETLVVEDGMGSFVIRRRPKGVGPGQDGGFTRKGAQSAHRGRRRGSRARSGANLNLSWSQFEQTFGKEQLQEQRQAYLEQRRSKARGGSRQRHWRKFRAAIENYVPDVRSGNQTALNTAASPFAAFLAAVHRRIHQEYAYRFLGNLPLSGGPFSDRSLRTDLEIVWNRDGTLHKVGVVRSSGFLPFDYGAFDAVMRATPFVAPPEQILSANGRAYVHWGFYRNERQCGTFNARPKILKTPPGTPKPSNPFGDTDDESHGGLHFHGTGEATHAVSGGHHHHGH